jgi:hypothetical protein
MEQETLKWILFPFSLTGRAKQWYNLNVQSVEGKWEVLRETFCHTIFSLAQISDLRCEIILFKQKEGESLGTAWARFTNILLLGGYPKNSDCDPWHERERREQNMFKHRARAQRDSDSPCKWHKFQKVWIRLHVPSRPLL